MGDVITDNPELRLEPLKMLVENGFGKEVSIVEIPVNVAEVKIGVNPEINEERLEDGRERILNESEDVEVVKGAIRLLLVLKLIVKLVNT